MNLYAHWASLSTGGREPSGPPGTGATEASQASGHENISHENSSGTNKGLTPVLELEPSKASDFKSVETPETQQDLDDKLEASLEASVGDGLQRKTSCNHCHFFFQEYMSIARNGYSGDNSVSKGTMGGGQLPDGLASKRSVIVGPTPFGRLWR